MLSIYHSSDLQMSVIKAVVIDFYTVLENYSSVWSLCLIINVLIYHTKEDKGCLCFDNYFGQVKAYKDRKQIKNVVASPAQQQIEGLCHF